MPADDRDQFVREYLWAKMHQPVGRRSFLRLSSGVIVAAAGTSAAAFLAACSAGGTASPAATASGGAPSSALSPAATAGAAATASAAPTPVASATSSPSASSIDITGAALNFLGLDGEDAAKVDLATKWRDDHKITLASKYIGSDDEVFAAIKAGQVYDIAMTFNPFMQRFAEAKVIAPIDTGRLTNWNDMFDGLRSADFLNVNGVPYGVPIAWGDGPYVYNPKKVTEAEKPHSILDLLDPRWKKRLILADDPGFPFYLVGLGLGFPAPNLTKQQLAKVAETCKPLVKEQTVAFAKSYADATDLLIRGEGDLTTLGWEAMLNFAKDKGGVLAFDFFKEARGGWSDSMTIPVNAANVDAAYAYIDAVIGPEISAQMAVSLVSGAVNRKAVPLIAQKDNIYSYDVVKTRQSGVFEDTLAPEKPSDPNIASHQDWLDAWAKLTA